MSKKLKGCPFCGEEPTIVPETIVGDCQIFCVCDANPSVIMNKNYLVEAKNRWNTRAGE